MDAPVDYSQQKRLNQVFADGWFIGGFRGGIRGWKGDRVGRVDGRQTKRQVPLNGYKPIAPISF